MIIFYADAEFRKAIYSILHRAKKKNTITCRLILQMPNYYDILGVDRDCDVEEIKKAYRRLAQQYHPDRNASPDAGEQMRLVNEAYQTLSDPAKRREYDALLDGGYTWQPDSQSYNPEGFRHFYWRIWPPAADEGSFVYKAFHAFTIRRVMVNAFLMGVLSGMIGDFLFYAFRAVAYNSGFTLPVLAIIGAAVAVASPMLGVAPWKSLLDNKMEAGALGLIALTAAMFTFMALAGLVIDGQSTYYGFACCIGPVVFAVPGIIMGWRLGEIYYMLLKGK